MSQNTTLSKRCARCKATKRLEEFGRKSASKDGRSSWCRVCNTENSLARFAARPEYYKKLKLRWRLANREHRNAYEREWNARNPELAKATRDRWNAKRCRTDEREKARAAVRRAIRFGRLQRLPCVVCGNPKSEGHHADYSKRLEVRWLCRKHHGEVHRKYQAAVQ